MSFSMEVVELNLKDDEEVGTRETKRAKCLYIFVLRTYGVIVKKNKLSLLSHHVVVHRRY